MTNKTKTLFPTMDNELDVLEEGVAKLPITTKNELAVLLATHGNTIKAERNKDVFVAQERGEDPTNSREPTKNNG